MSDLASQIREIWKVLDRMQSLEIAMFYKDTAVTSVTGAYNVLSSDNIIRASGTFAVTLPSATGSNKIYWVKNSGAGVITVTPAGADTIEGAANDILAAGEAGTYLDATAGNWEII